MMIIEDILEKMKVHFPRWMDIRRKVNTSTGGLYLTSIGESIVDIQSAIDDYKKDFFIDTYIGKEDDVIAFLYKTTIGTIDNIDVLALIIPEYTITEDENVFYNTQGYAYYSDGYLYFKEEEAKVIYSIDNYKYEGTLEKIHVWNIFDEFAIFLGLKRYQWETNKELLNRILAFAKVKVNSSEQGLKNAILANLVNIAPKLSGDDILIERPTAENLVKYYDGFETILDHLSHVNRDVYKEKRWDVDTWNFSIKSIDYIPHAWDILLSEYINGVGYKDDLKVQIIDAEPTTTVTIYFYKKMLEMVNDYIKNNNVKQTFKLNLKRFNENISSKNVKYRITASDARKINTNNISLKAIEEKIGDFNINIQDVISPSYDKTNITEEDRSLLDSDYNYVIDFIPTNGISNFSIDHCKQGQNDLYVDLLNANYPGFESNGEGLISTSSKKYIDNLYQLTSSQNIKKTIDGFEITDLSKESSMTINIDGCKGTSLFYDYDYKETILNLTSFTKTNCYIKDNYIVSDTVTGDKYVTINLIANSFSARIEGPYSIKYSIDDGEETNLMDVYNNVFDFKIDKSDTAKSIKLQITFLDSDCKLKNTMYSKYDFKMYTTQSSLVTSGSMIYLPNHETNNIIVTMKSYAGFSPVLKYIYIGNKLTEANGYYGIAFNTINGNKLDAKFENCRLQLKKFDKSGVLIDTVFDYKPYIEYTAREDVEVELILDDYTASSFAVDHGTIEIDEINPINKKYILTIPKGRALIYFDLFGKSNKPIVDQTLSSIINKKGINYVDYDFYITKNENSIIGKKKSTGELKYIKVYKEDLFTKFSTATIIIDCIDDNIVPKFILDGNLAVYSNSNKSDYKLIAFEPTQGNLYTAINEYNVMLPYTKDISIVNTFNNNYDVNSTSSMFFVLENLNEEFDVRFETNAAFELCDIKALDSTKISIKAKDLGTIDYNSDSFTVDAELLLGSSVEIPDSLTMTTGEIVDPRQFVLSMDFEINYFNKYTDSDNSLDYIFTDIVYVDSNRITKLKYSNINEIETILYNSSQLIKGLDYILLKDEGIVVWLNDQLNSLNKIEITYNINVARSFDVDLDDLYTQIKYPVNSLELISTAYMTDVKVSETINLMNYEDYSESDLISIKFGTAGFLSEINNGMLTLINNTPANSIAIKTGYYYVDGREFYLLADEKYDNINKVDSVNFHNVIKDNNSFLLKQKSENFITNSTFDLNTKSEILNLDCSEKDIQGISELNEISICETFNYWTTFASTLSIVSGYNGQGLRFDSLYETDGYCYLPLSKFIKDDKNYMLSFFLSGECKAYLGKEKTISNENIEFDYQSLIEIVDTINLSGSVDNIYEEAFTNKSNENYFLVLTGSGVIDDILLVEASKYDIHNHTKNLELLSLDIQENIYSDYNTRLYITDKNGGILDGTEINEDDNIINSSYVHWGYTKIKSINTYNDFKKCILDNVDVLQFDNKSIIKTGSKAGSITSIPIYVGNTNIIKNLLYKVNDVMFDSMQDFKIKLLASASVNSGYKEILVSTENINSLPGTNLSSYIKLMVEIPPNKVINNIEIFIEYLSNENSAPSKMEVTNGSYTSKVLDAQYNERYLVKSLSVENNSSDLGNYIFQIRASKENDEKTIWTSWKDVTLDSNHQIVDRITFIDYRYFQFRLLLKGENASIKINHIDLEVI